MGEAKDLPSIVVGLSSTSMRRAWQADRQGDRDDLVKRHRVDDLPKRLNDHRFVGINLDADELARGHQPPARTRHDAGQNFVRKLRSTLHPPLSRHDRQANWARPASTVRTLFATKAFRANWTAGHSLHAATEEDRRPASRPPARSPLGP